MYFVLTTMPARSSALSWLRDLACRGHVLSLHCARLFSSPLVVHRCCCRLDEQLIAARLERAAQLRIMLFEPYDRTNGFRLVNGEGDGLPGLVVDMYNDAAVMKLDGAGG